MKNRIWNQTKAAVLAMAAILSGICVPFQEMQVSGAELVAPVLNIEQSAKWTDEENYKAELTLRLSGLNTLKDVSKVDQEQEKIQAEMETESFTEDAGEKAEEDFTADEGEKAEEDFGEGGAVEKAETENPAMPEEKKEYILTTYISEYFLLDTASLPEEVTAETVSIKNQKGEDTEILRLTEHLQMEKITEDYYALTVPVTLRPEYQLSWEKRTYPVVQDEPLQKDQTGLGTFLQEKTGEELQTLVSNPSPELLVNAAKTGIEAVLRADVEKTKAGQPVNYILDVTNTGQLPLTDIQFSSSFSMEDIRAVWESESDFYVDGKEAVLAALNPGESRRLRMTLLPDENKEGDLFHTVTVKTKHPGREELIGCQAACQIKVEGLKASFEVEKTADRTEAFPGDTITYQICIRNTGEKTLHSVLSTERFLNANIQAQFMPKEGVTLNSTRTQALISSIAPGEALGLYAVVTIPQYFESQELVNEVTVISDETGTTNMKSRSEVTVKSAEVTVTPQITQTYSSYQSYGSGSKSGSAYETASKPSTGDDTKGTFFLALCVCAVIVGAAAAKKQR
ncbi:MAG: hypothetical protein ACLRHP_03150 [Blautia sp.]